MYRSGSDRFFTPCMWLYTSKAKKYTIEGKIVLTELERGKRISMSKINSFLAVLACKASRWGLRLLRRGGTNIPGQIAMKFDRKILAKTSAGSEVIIVTGTNGKTTTAHMIEFAMTQAGHECLANKTGANLLAGITAEFTCNATMSGKARSKYAVIECDEAALRHVVPLVNPKVIVVTNLFRDQLDRYGEVMNTLDLIAKGIEQAPESILCLNGDDSLTASLATMVKNRSVFFGISAPVGDQKDAEISDAKYCIKCGEEYKYKYHTYAHLGGYYCPKCGYKRPDPDVEVTDIRKSSFTGSVIRINVHGKHAEFPVNLPAVYNIYNAAAALSAYMAFGLPAKEMISALGKVKSSFGRMENFEFNGKNVQMILVKNPAGCNQVLEYLSEIEEDISVAISLNDNAADGHDISWIWDVDYESAAAKWKAKNIIVSGTRAEDMMLRLKYAGIPEENIIIEKSPEGLVGMVGNLDTPVFIMPNYTSMLTLRELVSSATGGKEYWKG